MISAKKKFQIFNINGLNKNNLSLSRSFAVLPSQDIINTNLIFNSFTNSYVILKDNHIQILASFRCILNINFDIDISSNNLQDFSYSIHTLRIEVNNKQYYRKRHGFDALNQINDNILFNFERGDIVKFFIVSADYRTIDVIHSNESKIGNNSFMYFNII